MPTLPSSSDVQQVSPRATRDPGVNVPAVNAPPQAFESPLGIASEELAPQLAEAVDRQLSRREAIATAKAENRFNVEADEKLRRLSTEADISDPAVLQEFGSFLATRQEELIGQTDMRSNARARLAVRLEGLAGQFTGRAAALSAAEGFDQLDRTLQNQTTRLASAASRDPERLDELLLEADHSIKSFSGALSSSQTDAVRARIRDQIAQSAIESTLSTGDVDLAKEMLDARGLSDILTPETQRTVRERITNIRLAQTETERLLAQAEMAKGAPLTQDERLQLIGIDSPGTEELVAINDATSTTGLRFVPRSQAVGQEAPPRSPLVSIDQPQTGTIPPGFQLVRDSQNPNILRMEAIPGGPADLAAQEEAQQRQAKSDVTIRAAQTVFEDTQRALDILEDKGRLAAGIGSVLSVIPESSAKAFKQLTESIKGNIGIDSLLKIKESGSGLGQVPQAQLEMLASLLGKLDTDQRPEDLEFNIKRVQEIYAEIVEKEGGDPVKMAEERKKRIDGESVLGFTLADVEATATAEGLTVDEVLDRVIKDRNLKMTRDEIKKALRI